MLLTYDMIDDTTPTEEDDNMPKKPLVTVSGAELDKIREEGRIEGLKEGRREILDWLENTYLDDPGRPDRGTPKAEAILELARDAGKYIRKGGNTPRLKP